jgi:hypothetical protein
MTPFRRLVQEWFPKERVEYLAHVATLFALVVTVAFSWLAWREARQARLDQAEHFIAEKAPRLEVIRAVSSFGMLYVDVRNTGDSVLRGLGYEALVQVPTMNATKSNRREERFEGKMAIQKAATLPVRILPLRDLQSLIGYAPASIEVVNDLGQLPQGHHSNATIAILFVYYDLLGNSYPHGTTLLLKRE